MGEARSVGGTLVSRIVGMSKFGGVQSAYFELREGLEAREETSMGRGKLLESSVLHMACERLGARMLAIYEKPPHGRFEKDRHGAAGKLVASSMPYAHATVDAIFDHGPQEDEAPRFRLTEAKTLAREQLGPEWGPDGSDRILPEYHLQVMWYLGVSRAAGLPVADVAAVPVLIGPESELQLAAKLVERTGKPLALADLDGTGMELRVYRVVWDEKIFRRCDERVKAFLAEHVAPGIPPMPSPGDVLMDRDRQAVKRGLKATKGKAVDINAMPPPSQAAVISYLEAVRQRKTWTDLETDRAATVQLLMGDTEEIHGLDGGARVTWKEIKGGSRRFELREPKR